MDAVLFVDDDVNVTQGLIRQLRHEPYRLLHASSGHGALEILAHEKIDLIITDEQMPLMTGAELVSRVRKKYPNIICMILSGQTDFQAAIKAINEGEIYRFLRKPCNALDMATDIRLALEQKDLIIHARQLLDCYRKNVAFINKLKAESPDLFELHRDDAGRIILETENGNPKETLTEIKTELDESR